MRRRSHNFKIPSIILVGVAAALLLAAAIWGGYNANFIRQATTVPGTVVDLIPVGRGTRGYHVKVAFTTLAGEHITYQPLSSARPAPFAIGDAVTVYYDPQHPQHAKLDWFLNLWFGPLMLAVAGGVNGLLSLIFAIIWYRQQRAKQLHA